MSVPTLATIKRLFALSGNCCAFPDCATPLVEESGTVTGEICHIRSASSGGPRFDKTQSESERHGAANLLLLCARHHKIVDSEPEKYPVSVLEAIKRKREQPGLVEISPLTTKAAEQLLNSYLSVTIHSNSGQIAIQSPGAIHAHTVYFKTSKPKVVVAPPHGTIANDNRMLSYVLYLIDRYQQFQKADRQKEGDFKYIAIHNALKRKFNGGWKFLPTERFDEVAGFLQQRIDKTKLGRINRAKGVSNYHPQAEHK